jgi:hypothetical protein
MFDSDEAAQPVTINAWKARTGTICLDEHTARVIGSTHVACSQCGKPTRYATLCGACSEQRSIARYDAMPAEAWDGKQMVYSETLDEYYSSPEDAAEDADDRECSEGLRLVLCTPQYARRLDNDDFADDLPEDGEVPDVLAAAIDAFNEATTGLVLSWYPGKSRLLIEEATDD